MRFSQAILSILSLASTTLSLPSLPDSNAMSIRQSIPPDIYPSPPNSQPAGSTLVQVGFNAALNYDFVSSNPSSAQQIFSLLPQGIAYGLGIPTGDVVMESLRGLDTSNSLGYITTLARFWIPSDEVTTFRIGIVIPASNFYNNPDAVVNNLMRQINPSIPTTP
ncbi:hypothetical protein CC78DRAFT_570974 [Lojkania enalia]|uniref:Uncharacterized protein n=1 Tax=Lojkania enalia TaxID=147567 RepID=A0A9P4K1H5_9PLEO|nr:hypothetical protein CC78DRAFT_570974 [Didymosphaeria enalia]